MYITILKCFSSSCFYFIMPKIYLLKDYAGSACTLNKNENTKSGTVNLPVRTYVGAMHYYDSKRTLLF